MQSRLNNKKSQSKENEFQDFLSHWKRAKNNRGVTRGKPS